MIELLPPDREGRLKIARSILSECEGEIGDVVDEGEGETAAQFTERCVRIALREHWRGRRHGA